LTSLISVELVTRPCSEGQLEHERKTFGHKRYCGE
jgi:hypothetical protein